MIEIKKVLEFHSIQIKNYGGSDGIRDENLLDSAINRPFTTFDGNDLYPTAIDKSSALIESMVKNHPFIDGNKRTGYFLMRYFLKKNGYDIKCDQDIKYQFVINIASGKLNFDDIKLWIEKYIVEI